MRRGVVYLGMERVVWVVFDGLGKVWREVSRVSVPHVGGDWSTLAHIFHNWGVNEFECTLVLSDIYALGIILENGGKDYRAAAARYVNEHFAGMHVAWTVGARSDDASYCLCVTERARLDKILQIVRSYFPHLVQVLPEGILAPNLVDDWATAAVQVWDDPRIRAVQLLNLDVRWKWLSLCRPWRGVFKVAALVPLMLAVVLEWTTLRLDVKTEQLTRQIEAHMAAAAHSEHQQCMLERLEKVAAELRQMRAEQVAWIHCLAHVQKVCEDYGPVWVENLHVHEGRKMAENADVARGDWARSLHLWMHFATFGEGWEMCKHKIQVTLASLASYQSFGGMERVQVLAQNPGWLKLQCELKLREGRVL